MAYITWLLVSFLKISLSAQHLGNDLLGEEVSPEILYARNIRQAAPIPSYYFLGREDSSDSAEGTAKPEEDKIHPETRNGVQGEAQNKDEKARKDYFQALKEVFGTQETPDNLAKSSEHKLYVQVNRPVHKKGPHKLKLHLPKTAHPLKLLQLRHELRTKSHSSRKHMLLSPAPESMRSSLDQPQAEQEENSAEMLSQILGSSMNDENPLHGAVLARVTTYNITKVLDPKHGKGFLLEKKENVSTNVNYLDSRERFTNYSDVHSSSLNRIISEKDLQLSLEDNNLNGLHSGMENTSGKKNSEVNNGRTDDSFSEENSVYVDSIKRKSDHQTTHGQEEGHPEMGTEGILGKSQDSGDFENTQLIQDHKDGTDFLAGQFIPKTQARNRANIVTSPYLNTAETRPYPNDFIGGQFVQGENVGRESETLRGKMAGGKLPIGFVGNQLVQQNITDSIEVSSEPTSHKIKDPDNDYPIISILGKTNTDAEAQDNDDKNLQNNVNKVNKKLNENKKSLPDEDTKGKAMKAKTKFGHESEAVESSSNNTRGPLFYSYESSVDDTLGDARTTVPEEETTMNPDVMSSADSTLQDAEQEDDILGSENDNEHSILQTDPDTGHLVTEKVENYSPSHNTDPHNIQEIIRTTHESEEISTDSPTLFNNNMGEFTELQPVIIKSQMGDHSLNSGEANPASIDDVELYAGTPPMLITISDKGGKSKFSTSPPHLKDGPSNVDIVVFDENNENITELCLPLGNKHNLTLFDIISSDFYIEKNGKKIPLYLRENPLKNCTSGSMTCKLYLDLKDDVNKSIEKELSVKNVNGERKTRFGKRHVSNDDLVNLNLERLIRQTTEKYSKEPKALHGQRSVDERISDLKNKQIEYPIFLYTLSNYKTANRFRPIAQLNHYDSINDKYKPRNSPDFTVSSENISRDVSPKHQLAKHNNRPTRGVHHKHYDDDDDDDDRKEEDCACSNSDHILQSALLSTPSYKHFVGKRLNILKNIVTAVSDWTQE